MKRIETEQNGTKWEVEQNGIKWNETEMEEK
jgi:hypothetical protein